MACSVDGSRRQPKVKRPRIYKMEDDGGYSVLHPTRGWRHFTVARVNRTQTADAKRRGLLPWWQGVHALERQANG